MAFKISHACDLCQTSTYCITYIYTMASCEDALSMLLLITIIYISLGVYKKSFVNPDGISVILGNEDMGKRIETRMFSSMWNLKQERGQRGFACCYSNKSMVMVLLMLCGDIESCPGPFHVPLEEFINSRGLKVFHHNMRGLFSNFVHVQELFDRCKGVDIMTLSETHIVDRHYDDVEGLFIIDGCKFIKRNRKRGLAGGVAVYIKDNILWKRRYDLETNDIESIWLEIFIAKSKSILIATFYRPPGSSVYLPNDFNKTFNDMLLNGTKENKEIIILGDFNADYLKPNDNKEIKGIFQLFGFKQLIKTATRITKESSTLIDLI